MNGSNQSSGRAGWICAALLLGILAGCGVMWFLLNRHSPNPPVVVYQLPPATLDTPSDSLPKRTPPVTKRRHYTLLPASDLPPVLQQSAIAAAQTASPTPPEPTQSPNAVDPSLPHVGVAPPPNAEDDRQTVLIDGVALTPPATGSPHAEAISAKSPRPVTSAQVDESLALALAGLNTHEKEKLHLREDAWGGGIEPGKPRAISHQLYKGNDYWFSMGTGSQEARIDVRVYDSEGHPTETTSWKETTGQGGYAGAEILCPQTGTYFIVIAAEAQVGEQIPWGLVYAYR